MKATDATDATAAPSAKMQPDRVREHAKTAAAYFQALLVEGVHPSDALSLTGSYMHTTMVIDKPKEDTPT